MSRLVVTDASCLIALDLVSRLDVLTALYDETVAPHAVVAEFGRRPEWLVEHTVTDRVAVRLLLQQGLHEGEAEAITLARALRPDQLLIDERRGRRAAAGFGLSVIGTGGVLVAAKRIGLVDQVRPILDTLRTDHDFRLGALIYDALVREAGEADDPPQP